MVRLQILGMHVIHIVSEMFFERVEIHVLKKKDTFFTRPCVFVGSERKQ